MGSLMAGWDSPVSDPNAVKFRRNKSLTKDEIEAYWKSKKQKEEEHLRDISLLSPRSQGILFEEAKRRKLHESSPEEELLDMESEANIDKLIQKNGWWISSNSAFLNEPPVIATDGTAKKYVSQVHVTRMAGSTTSSDRTGVSA